MATYPVAGISSTFINGSAYTTGTDITYNAATQKIEYVENWSGDYAYKTTPIPAKVMIKLVTAGGFDPSIFSGTANNKVQVFLANGNTFLMTNAACTEVGDASAGDGTVELTFEAANASIG